jgi:hypothetical protein
MSANFVSRSFKAAGAIGDRLITKYTANRGEVAQASAATDRLAGAVEIGAEAAGDIVDVAREGMGKVTVGGVVAAGDHLTGDANGKAVKAVGVAGQSIFVIGQAEEPGVANDIIHYTIAPSVIVLPAA